MAEEKRLLLIDGMAIVYRAFFGMIRSPRITSRGEDVSGVFGFVNILLDLLREYETDHAAVAFDAHGPTFRHELFPDYKATRDETPEGIRSAVPRLKTLLEAFGIPMLEYPGFEADDVIGTLARRAEREGFTTYMATPDKDFAQLVDERTFMLKPGRAGGAPELLDPAKIREQWGIESPRQVIDILGLAGDASDNVPGVPGVGPKTARKLIAEFGSVENLLEHTDRLKGKLRERIEQNREKALLSKRLVTIRCDVPLKESPDSLRTGARDERRLRRLFEELEFRSLIKRLFGEAPTPKEARAATVSLGQGDLFEFAAAKDSEAPAAAPRFETLADVPHDYRLVVDAAGRKALAERLAGLPAFCFDLETTSLNVFEAELVGVAFCAEPAMAWFATLPPDREQAKLALEPFRAVWENRNVAKIGQNLKYDLLVLKRHGFEVNGTLLDTMLAHYLVEPDRRHGMDRMAESLLGYSPIAISELIGERKAGQRSMRDVDPQRVRDYACEDADVTLRLWRKLEPMLAERGQERVFREIETPLLPVLVEMESEGVALDVDALRDYSLRLAEKIEGLEREIFEMAGGEPFNLNSPKQLGEVLFDRLELAEKPKKTRTGQYKTDESVLSDLAASHEIARRILDYRGLVKLKGTYVDALPREVRPETGRVHATFRQAVTSTGRLSCENPNLQNVPVRTEEGREIRRAFIPREGFLMLSCDYSQIELRIMAELSGDEALREAFASGEDVHRATAARIFGVEPEAVTRDMRSKAKMVNFGIIYGISAFGLARRLRIPRAEAKSIIDQYRAAHPGVQEWLDRTLEFAREHGYVETVTGRRRYVRDVNARNQTVRAAAERNAINAPVQGTAADLIKLAMIRVAELLRERRARTRMLLQVHDELVFDLHPDERDLVPLVEEKMRAAIPMTVPVLVESGIGKNWLEAH